MFTKQQLAKWRSEGFVFPEFYDEVAVDEKKNQEDPKDIILKEEVNEKVINDFFSVGKINEDDKERYIRKTLHKIKESKINSRKVNIRMINSYVYHVKNFDFDGVKISRIIMQVKNNGYLNINVSKFKDIETSVNPFVNKVYTGFIFDEKLSFFFENQKDKDFVLNYINGKWLDKFVPAFSEFDWKKINNQIILQKSIPYKVNQGGTPLCGIVCIAYLMLKYQWKSYLNFVNDLFNYAEAFYGKNDFLIKPRNSVFGQIYDISPLDSAYPKMPQADYISLASIKCSENSVFTYDGEDDGKYIDGLGGMSLSGDLVKLLDQMIGAKNIENQTNYTGSFFDEMKKLKEMQEFYKYGNECFMLIDSTMLNESAKNIGQEITSRIPYPNHWVIYAGGSPVQDPENDKVVKINVYTYGGLETLELSSDFFINTFYGFITCKLDHEK